MPTLQVNYKFANQRYLLLKRIGVGGYSEVWLAEDTKAGNLEVALKIFAPEKGLDSKGLEVFSKEYSLVFNLNHKNLLIPKHFDEFEGSPYLVLPYCRQGSVFGKIGEVTEQELARFMQQAASALNYLHNQDPPIIHQDIKPDNFLIDGRGNYLLADFGISSKIRRTLTKSLGAQASTGTLAYMPPEKFSADKQIIKAGDIFSLGVTIYELLTGDLPFGDHGGMVILTGAQVPNLPSGFSPELNTLLKRCMAKEPWERPTAEQLEETATKFLQAGQWSVVVKDVPNPTQEQPKEPEQPRAGRKTEPIPQPQPELQSRPLSEVEGEAEAQPTKKNRTIWIISVVVLLVSIMAIVWLNFTPSHPSTDQSRSIKDTYAGGIIFYLDETGKYGKVCAPYDQSESSTWDQAKSICNNLNLNGYHDWYLPSKKELNEMYESLYNNDLGGFANHYYWSSSEYDEDSAWGQNFKTGYQGNGNKHLTYYVRAVRAF